MNIFAHNGIEHPTFYESLLHIATSDGALIAGLLLAGIGLAALVRQRGTAKNPEAKDLTNQ